MKRFQFPGKETISFEFEKFFGNVERKFPENSLKTPWKFPGNSWKIPWIPSVFPGFGLFYCKKPDDQNSKGANQEFGILPFITPIIFPPFPSYSLPSHHIPWFEWKTYQAQLNQTKYVNLICRQRILFLYL